MDRDGVLNYLVLNPENQHYESPHFIEDFRIIPTAPQALKRMQSAGYLLFLISNQPSYTLGKTSLENIQAIEQTFAEIFSNQGIEFTQYYYCHHHPDGIRQENYGECECRKPKPYFILKAKERYDLDLKQSWMIGDQDTDVFCGQAVKVKTVLIQNPHSRSKRGQSRPDYMVDTIEAAVGIILDNSNI